MLDIRIPRTGETSGRVTRRDFLSVGAAVTTGSALADWLKTKAHGQSTHGTAKSLIQIWLAGGLSHLDTFDPKPQAGPDYCGLFTTPIATNVDGIQIAQTLPMMAQQMDKCAVLRGMTHPNNRHETATRLMQTSSLWAFGRSCPAGGSMVTRTTGRFARYHDALPQLIEVTAGLDGRPRLKWIDMDHQTVCGPVPGETEEALGISKETDKLRDRYGRTAFGQSCLLARWLVEDAAPFVTIHWGGWDTHTRHFQHMARLLPDLDRGLSALLEDLARRGLLETTIVTCFGEFGRTPQIARRRPWSGGRHHFAGAFSAVVAGGGFHGGRVVGATDARGETVVDRPVRPGDLAASINTLLGIYPSCNGLQSGRVQDSATAISSAQCEWGTPLSEIIQNQSPEIPPFRR